MKWLTALWKQGSNGMLSGGVGSDATVVARGPVAFPGCLGQRATTSTQWKVPGRYGPNGEPFFFLLEKEPMVLRELSRLGPSIRPHGELLLLDAEEADLPVPDSEAFNSYIGNGFLVPELKDGSEASKDEQADSSSENNVGNGALFVTGLHRSGGAIALFLQDWEVRKVALSCHVALDVLCQELHDVESMRDLFGF